MEDDVVVVDDMLGTCMMYFNVGLKDASGGVHKFCFFINPSILTCMHI